MGKPSIDKKSISIRIPVEEWEFLNNYAVNQERIAITSYVTSMVREKIKELKQE